MTYRPFFSITVSQSAFIYLLICYYLLYYMIIIINFIIYYDYDYYTLFVFIY